MFWGIKNNFLIKRWMKSEFMMLRMAGPKGVVIVPTYEGKDRTEERRINTLMILMFTGHMKNNPRLEM